ncbi:hypothetical protein JYT87_03355 [Nitrospira defluvii]|nr:hypothetical protein [Nitrospira defluvii]
MNVLYKIEYLLSAKRSTFSNYVFTSYRSEKETLQNLADIKIQRPLKNIEKIIIKKIKNRLRKDKISLKRLFSNRNWKLDGKSFKQLLKSLNKENDYPFVFGQGSSFIHGSWYEMSIYNIEKRGRYYVPNLDFGLTTPRFAIPITIAVLQTTSDFIKWNESDPDNYFRSAVHGLIDKSHLIYQHCCNRRDENV